MRRDERGAAATTATNGGKVERGRERKPPIRGKGPPRLMPRGYMAILLLPRLDAGVKDDQVIIHFLREAKCVHGTLGEQVADGRVQGARRELYSRRGRAGGVARDALEEGVGNGASKV